MSSSPYSALVVDDDVDLCHLLVKVLAINKIQAATAHTLVQAEECLHKVKPKLVLLDNNLPDGLGIDFIKVIRDFDPDIKVMMITGDTARDIRERAIDEGIDAFIAKPFSYEKILRESHNLIQASKD